jgi:hypothetical protein
MVLATPITAFAAMDATLSSGHARPGDMVLLLTDDHNRSASYQGLATENHQPIYLAPTAVDFMQACDGPASQPVGRLEWRGNAGGVVFVVPSLPFADYWLFMKTSGQCWRIASTTGASREVLVLTIGSTPADNQDVAGRWTVDSLAPSPGPVSQQSRTSPTSGPPALMWLGLVGVCAVVLLAIFVVIWKVRAREQVSG